MQDNSKQKFLFSIIFFILGALFTWRLFGLSESFLGRVTTYIGLAANVINIASFFIRDSSNRTNYILFSFLILFIFFLSLFLDFVDTSNNSPQIINHYYYENSNDTQTNNSPITTIKDDRIYRNEYYPISNCAASHLYIGDNVYVSMEGGRNAIRSEPDTHPSNNIIASAYPGDELMIIGGPECNYGYILWKVRMDNGVTGWTPESDGREFWLIPMD